MSAPTSLCHIIDSTVSYAQNCHPEYLHYIALTSSKSQAKCTFSTKFDTQTKCLFFSITYSLPLWWIFDYIHFGTGTCIHNVTLQSVNAQMTIQIVSNLFRLNLRLFICFWTKNDSRFQFKKPTAKPSSAIGILVASYSKSPDDFPIFKTHLKQHWVVENP